MAFNGTWKIKANEMTAIHSVGQPVDKKGFLSAAGTGSFAVSFKKSLDILQYQKMYASLGVDDKACA